MQKIHITFLVDGASDEAWKLAGDLEAKLAVLVKAGKARTVVAWVEDEGRPPAETEMSAETFSPQTSGRTTSIGDIPLRRPST